jgi:preprotein translocase subunit SecE
MARQTRAQRRARRAEATRDGAPDRSRATQLPAAQAARVEGPARDHGAERRLPGGGFRRFVAESWAELKKVEWPTQNQLIQGTVVVLIACVIVGVYLWGADIVLKRFVENVLLGQ